MIEAELNVSTLCSKFNSLSDIDIEQVIKDSCLAIESQAKKNLTANGSVDTGQLRMSIDTNVYSEGTTTIGEVGSNVLYAPYVELGTGLFAENGDGRQDVPWRYQDAEGNWHSTCGQKPKPYLKPALDDEKPNIEKRIKAEVQKNV